MVELRALKVPGRGKPFPAAADRGFGRSPFLDPPATAAVLGQKEAIDGTVIIKDMASGNQEIINGDKLIDEVKKRLKMGGMVVRNQ